MIFLGLNLLYTNFNLRGFKVVGCKKLFNIIITHEPNLVDTMAFRIHFFNKIKYQ